jgi:hypothetical protein
MRQQAPAVGPSVPRPASPRQTSSRRAQRARGGGPGTPGVQAPQPTPSGRATGRRNAGGLRNWGAVAGRGRHSSARPRPAPVGRSSRSSRLERCASTLTRVGTWPRDVDPAPGQRRPVNREAHLPRSATRRRCCLSGLWQRSPVRPRAGCERGEARGWLDGGRWGGAHVPSNFPPLQLQLLRSSSPLRSPHTPRLPSTPHTAQPHRWRRCRASVRAGPAQIMVNQRESNRKPFNGFMADC